MLSFHTSCQRLYATTVCLSAFLLLLNSLEARNSCPGQKSMFAAAYMLSPFISIFDNFNSTHSYDRCPLSRFIVPHIRITQTGMVASTSSEGVIGITHPGFSASTSFVPLIGFTQTRMVASTSNEGVMGITHPSFTFSELNRSLYSDLS